MIPSYPELWELVEGAGDRRDSRMGPVREMVGGQVCWQAGELVTRKGINDALGFQELMQILAGIFDIDQIKRVAPRAQHELFTEQMAYGPRIAWQVPRVLDKLRRDPDTRQAVLWVGSSDDGVTDALPCTAYVQLLVRDGELHSVAAMRSWDITRGLAYDIVFQGGLVLAAARCLGVKPGWCWCQAGSMHLYEDQAAKRPEWRDRSFAFDETVPTEWGEVQAWALREVYAMDRVPAGVVVGEDDR